MADGKAWLTVEIRESTASYHSIDDSGLDNGTSLEGKRRDSKHSDGKVFTSVLNRADTDLDQRTLVVHWSDAGVVCLVPFFAKVTLQEKFL